MQASFFSTQALAAIAPINLVDQFIPANFFLSLADGIIPATVLFCLFLGFALMLDDGSGPIVNILRLLLRALDRMTHIISMTFPFGIFVITAVTAGTLTVEGFLELQVFLITLAAAAVLLGLVVMPLLITCFTTFRYRDILAAASRAMLLAFSTGTEFITLPLISEGVEKLFRGKDWDPDHHNESGTDGSPVPDTSGGTRRTLQGIPVRHYTCDGPAEPGQDRAGGTCGRTARSWYRSRIPSRCSAGSSPSSSSSSLPGCTRTRWISPGRSSSIIVGIPSFLRLIQLSVLSLLDLLRLPEDAYSLYLSSGILRQAFVAPLSVISIFSFSTITIALTTNRARFRWKRAILSIVAVVLLAAVLIAGLHAGFAYLLAGTYHGSDQITGIELPRDPAGNRLDQCREHDGLPAPGRCPGHCSPAPRRER